MGVSLLPLPLEEARRITGSPCAKNTRRRRGLGKHIDEVCDAVNSLSSAKAGAALRSGEAPRDLFSATSSQLEARRGFARQIRRLGAPESPAGALEELLKTHDVYDLDRQVSVRPYELSAFGRCAKELFLATFYRVASCRVLPVKRPRIL